MLNNLLFFLAVEPVSNPGFSAASLLTPLIVVMIIAGLFMVALKMAKNYIKVAPNEVLILYGRRYKKPDGTVQGYKMVSGGAAFQYPLLEHSQVMSLNAFQTIIVVNGVPSKEGAQVTVEAVATLRIGREEEHLEAAASRFLGQTPKDIEAFAKQILEGGLRSMVATMTVEELVKEREQFGTNVQKQVVNDLSKLGIDIDSFLIQNIKDEHGYIEALGKKKTAEVKKEAAVGEAEAQRDEKIKCAEATREAAIRSSEALRLGEIAKAEATKAISDAEKDRDMTVAQNKASVDAANARIPIIAQTAQAEQTQKLNVAQVEAEQAKIEAQIKLQEKEKTRKQRELEATLITVAEQEKDAKIIKANATKEAAVIEAEGNQRATEINAEAARYKAEREAEAARITAEKAGEGEKAKLTAAADGRKAAANALQCEKEAEAAGTQAGLLANAEGKKAELLAQAEGEKAKLLAEADGKKAILTAEAEGKKLGLLAEGEGLAQKAEAMAKVEASGKFMIIVENAPKIIEALGKAIAGVGEAIFAPMSGSIASGLGSIDKLSIVDFGGGSGQSDPLNKMATLGPQIILKTLASFGATGLLAPLVELAKQKGLDISSLVGIVEGEKGQSDSGRNVTMTPVTPEVK